MVINESFPNERTCKGFPRGIISLLLFVLMRNTDVVKKENQFLLGWAESLYGFFFNILWKNPNELSG